MIASDPEIPFLEARVVAFSGDGLLGRAELIIGGAFVIKDILILKAGGMDWRAEVVFPARRGRDRDFPIAGAVNPEARRAAEGAVLAAYRRG